MCISSYIDHTILKPNILKADILKHCFEANLHQFKAVCIAPYFVSVASDELKNSDVKIATVIGFPHGNQSVTSKCSEIQDVLNDGVDELDVVVNLSAINNCDFIYLENEVEAIIHASQGRTIKLIIESGLWSDDLLKKIVLFYSDFKIHYIKTSTGYFDTGVTIKAIEIISNFKNEHQKIKASGGIKTREQALKYIDLGVDRIGTSSGIHLIN